MWFTNYFWRVVGDVGERVGWPLWKKGRKISFKVLSELRFCHSQGTGCQGANCCKDEEPFMAELPTINDCHHTVRPFFFPFFFFWLCAFFKYIYILQSYTLNLNWRSNGSDQRQCVEGGKSKDSCFHFKSCCFHFLLKKSQLGLF